MATKGAGSTVPMALSKGARLVGSALVSQATKDAFVMGETYATFHDFTVEGASPRATSIVKAIASIRSLVTGTTTAS